MQSNRQWIGPLTAGSQREAIQQPTYGDATALTRAFERLRQSPPLVTSWEIEALREQIAAAQKGDAFVLQGGDCSENFDECTSENIVRKLKILLQMSVVLTAGSETPGGSPRADGGPVCETAICRHGNARRCFAAELPRRSRQQGRVRCHCARARSAIDAARSRARGHDFELSSGH